MIKTLKITLQQNIDTSYSAHNYLSEIANKVKTTDADNIIIDFSNINFIAANQFAILGSIIDSCKPEHCTVNLADITPPKILDIIRRNDFGKYFKLSHIVDKNNTVIPYRCFDVDDIIEYEIHLTLSLFDRNDLPKMSPGVSDEIRDYLLEVFKNVKDHTSSSKVYTCGQYFPKTSMLYFSLVDTGETIAYNVSEYHNKHSLSTPSSCLSWALESGNTTLDNGSPRGLGLSLIKGFVLLNQGYFCIVSGPEAFEISKKGERYMDMKHPFPGTIVTIAFNLDDDAAYYMKDEIVPEIQF